MIKNEIFISFKRFLKENGSTNILFRTDVLEKLGYENYILSDNATYDLIKHSKFDTSIGRFETYNIKPFVMWLLNKNERKYMKKSYLMFYKWLKQENLYDTFLKNLLDYGFYRSNESQLRSVKTLRDYVFLVGNTPHTYIMNSFLWSRTLNEDFWRDADLRWRKYLQDEINKDGSIDT